MLENKDNPILTKVCVIYLHDPGTLPKPSDDKRFSVDVCIVDEDGLHGVGYYSFKVNKWYFHIEPFADGQSKWYWYYPAINKEMIDNISRTCTT